MKALIVDDEQPARSTIRLLADWTLYDIDEVLEAETVEQAITCLRRSRPQIIIANKCDALDESVVDTKAFEEFVDANGWEMLYVPAAGTGDCYQRLQ